MQIEEPDVIPMIAPDLFPTSVATLDRSMNDLTDRS
jgi:hypothetical protein